MGNTISQSFQNICIWNVNIILSDGIGKKRLIKKQDIKQQGHCKISKGDFALTKCAMFKVNISSYWAADALPLLCSHVSAQFHFTWAKQSLCLGWNQFWRNKMDHISSVTWSASYKKKEHVLFPENQRSLRHLQNLGNLHDFFQICWSSTSTTVIFLRTLTEVKQVQVAEKDVRIYSRAEQKLEIWFLL